MSEKLLSPLEVKNCVPIGGIGKKIFFLRLRTAAAFMFHILAFPRSEDSNLYKTDPWGKNLGHAQGLKLIIGCNGYSAKLNSA